MVGAAIWKYIDRKNSRFLPSGSWTGHYRKWFSSLIYPWISWWFSDFPWFFVYQRVLRCSLQIHWNSEAKMWRFLLPTVLVLHLGHFLHFFTEDFRNKPLSPVGYLSGWWFGTWLLYLLFFHMLGIIIPFDELIFFSGVETTNQLLSTSWFMLKNHQLQFSGKISLLAHSRTRLGQGISLSHFWAPWAFWRSLTCRLKHVIFHSYVSWPEGKRESYWTPFYLIGKIRLDVPYFFVGGSIRHWDWGIAEQIPTPEVPVAEGFPVILENRELVENLWRFSWVPSGKHEQTNENHHV